MERVLSSGGILITGTSGQVGAAVQSLLRETRPETTLLTPDRAAMDLADAGSIRRYVRETRPRWIVSCAAYTAVDAAETDRDAAWAINAIAPGVLAEEALRVGAELIHLSTDYVFPGTGDRPWVETDATGPLNVYGASKLAGELAVAATGVGHIILRTSWVYSATGKNFVRTMLRLLTTKDAPLRVVADQHGAPTATDDLAAVIAAIVRRAEPLQTLSGVYHCAGGGETTWAGFASAIRRYLLSKQIPAAEIVPVPGSEYPTPAARPGNSRLDCGKLRSAFGLEMPEWQTSLMPVLNELTATDLPGRG